MPFAVHCLRHISRWTYQQERRGVVEVTLQDDGLKRPEEPCLILEEPVCEGACRIYVYLIQARPGLSYFQQPQIMLVPVIGCCIGEHAEKEAGSREEASLCYQCEQQSCSIKGIQSLAYGRDTL